MKLETKQKQKNILKNTKERTTLRRNKKDGTGDNV